MQRGGLKLPRPVGKTKEVIPSIPVLWVVLLLFLPIEVLAVYCYHVASEAWKNTIVFGASVVAGAFGLYSHMKHIEEVRVMYAAKPIERWGSSSTNVDSWKDLLRDVTAGTITKVAQYARTREANDKIVLPKTEDLIVRSKIVGPSPTRKRSLSQSGPGMQTRISSSDSLKESLRRASKSSLLGSSRNERSQKTTPSIVKLKV
jgi:hypothetical protein